MPELRWILLGLGVLFCLGLWWWESRRGRQAADSQAQRHPAETLTSTSTTIVRDAYRHAGAALPVIERSDDALPAWEESLAAANEQDDDSPADDFARAAVSAGSGIASPGPERPAIPEPFVDIAAERSSRDLPSAIGRIEPFIGDAAAVVGRSPSSASISVAPTPPSPEEKIVTLRVAAPPLERFEGRTLVSALHTAGLEHGRFSIFHKSAADGATLFSVASLIEPGTFDLDAIEGRRFPGVSFFTVLRNASAGGAILEDMLATARALASSLHGMLQDERGAPMSPQRLADLRADVAAWARHADSSSSVS